MKTDKQYMELALQEAQKALEMDEVPIGAIVICDGKIVGRGYNLKEELQDPTAHAEMIAIREASQNMGSWRLPECELYVTLEPCPMCIGAMIQARIKRLVYGASDEKGGATGSLYNLAEDERFNHQIEVVSGVLADKSSKMLKDFFRSLRT
mgnify:FL=1